MSRARRITSLTLVLAACKASLPVTAVDGSGANHAASTPANSVQPATARVGVADTPAQAAGPCGVGTEGPASSDEIAAVCTDRKPCRVLRRTAAGADDRGRCLAVIELSLWAESRDPAAERTDTVTCEPKEVWSLAQEPDGALQAERLLELCNDGYGASGVGEDTLTVSKNRLEHAQYGGSSWRWTTTTRRQLSPLRVLAEGTESWWNLGPNFSSQEWDWEQFSGGELWYTPPCDASGNPVEPGEQDQVGPRSLTDLPPTGTAYRYIPALPLPEAFAGDGYKSTQLGRCAVDVDGTAGHGFLVHGATSSREDAWFRAVLSQAGVLFVEVVDDHLVGPSDKWLHDDHLELWLSGSAPDTGSMCREPSHPHLEQWAIRLADGAVFPAYGKPKAGALRADVSLDAEHHVHVRVQLPDGVPPAITIVYSDSDDGVHQESLLATSRLRFGAADSLGRAQKVDEKRATCAVENGRLEPVLRP